MRDGFIKVAAGTPEIRVADCTHNAQQCLTLMRQAAETPRFREVSLFAFASLHDEDRQMQFAAVSFLLPDGSVYAAYRGTDMTIVGWQEDFNMSFLSAVPAQVISPVWPFTRRAAAVR